MAYLEINQSRCRYCGRGDYKILSRRENLRSGSLMLLECQGCGRLRSEQAKVTSNSEER
jgi:uncharacterized Zn finger protein